MATVQKKTVLRGESRIVLSDVSWELYEQLREKENNRHVHMAYDQGTLELMSPSRDHELIKTLVARMIEAFTEEMGIPLIGLGSMTWKSRELGQGIEADECYYIANQPRVCHRPEIDLAVDPPPDLVVETEVSRSVARRLRIYAGLGVPEIWRWRRSGLAAYALAEGKYLEREFSLNLPMLRVKDIEPFLDFKSAADQTAWIRKFRSWVRERFLGTEGARLSGELLNP